MQKPKNTVMTSGARNMPAIQVDDTTMTVTTYSESQYQTAKDTESISLSNVLTRMINEPIAVETAHGSDKKGVTESNITHFSYEVFDNSIVELYMKTSKRKNRPTSQTDPSFFQFFFAFCLFFFLTDS